MRRSDAGALRAACLATVLAAAGCAHAPARHADDLVVQARGFMESYAQDLRAHDREALARRYDADGTWFLGDGDKDFESYAQIAARYRDHWRGPAAFAWVDLTYEPLPPDAVVVLGGFDWQAQDAAAPAHYSYSALLRVTPDGLRIRVEDESRAAK